MKKTLFSLADVMTVAICIFGISLYGADETGITVTITQMVRNPKSKSFQVVLKITNHENKPIRPSLFLLNNSIANVKLFYDKKKYHFRKKNMIADPAVDEVDYKYLIPVNGEIMIKINEPNIESMDGKGQELSQGELELNYELLNRISVADVSISKKWDIQLHGKGQCKILPQNK